MPIEVETPDGGVAEFPDGTPPDQIKMAMRKRFASTGAGATLSKVEGISQTPWFQRPMASVLPDAISRHLPETSVQDLTDLLPAAGGIAGGALASPGVVTSVGGAAFGGASGEAARQLALRAMGARAPATSTDAALGIAKEAAIQGGAQGVGEGVGALLKGGGVRLMQSAAKPNVSLLKQYKTTAPKLVQTLLDEGINVSPGGLEKLDRLLTATNKEISDAVVNAQGSIPRDIVTARVLPTARKMSQQVNPRGALRDVANVVEEFRTGGATPLKGQGFTIAPPTAAPLSIPEAQAMKVGTYQQIGKSYGQMSNAKVEAQKALARGLKEEIEAAVPKIRDLNARDARLMAANEAVGRRVSVAGNRDPVGFAWTASYTPQTFLAALIDRSPAVKSMLARGMYASAGKAAKVSPQLIRAAVVALTSGESEDEPVQQ